MREHELLYISFSKDEGYANQTESLHKTSGEKKSIWNEETKARPSIDIYELAATSLNEALRFKQSKEVRLQPLGPYL